MLNPLRIETGAPLTRDYVRTVLKSNLQNYTTSSHFATVTSYFFRQPTFDQEPSFPAIRNLLKFFKQSGCSIAELYHGFLEEVEKIPDTPKDWTVENIKKVVHFEMELDEEVWQFRMRMLRLALTAGVSGPSVADIMYVLGKERSLQRFRAVDKAFERAVVNKGGKLVLGEKIEKVEEQAGETKEEDEDEDEEVGWKIGGGVGRRDGKGKGGEDKEKGPKKWERKVSEKKAEKAGMGKWNKRGQQRGRGF